MKTSTYGHTETTITRGTPLRKIYLASSWRNAHLSTVRDALRSEGYEVYDFREHDAFHWNRIGINDMGESRSTFLAALESETAQKGFKRDMEAMTQADTCILVLPSGRSSHVELGWCAAHPDKHTIVLLDQHGRTVPELSYLLADEIAPTLDHLLNWLSDTDPTTTYTEGEQQCQ